jgi:hypothetical protein
MKTLSIAVFVVSGLILTSVDSKAQQTKQTQTLTIEVIQFYSEHRCVTCVQIEKMTRATLEKSFKNIPFTLVNVDDSKNARKSEQFEATGTALYLFNPKTGKKKDLTQFAFMKAFDEKEFEIELKKHIEDFMKS